MKGLTQDQVKEAREKYGINELHFKKTNPFIAAMLQILKEPMVILLMIAASIYFTIGEYSDGLFLGMAIIMIGAISLFQDARSRKALQELKSLTQVKCKVIRDSQESEVPSADLVIGDLLIVEEGSLITADGRVIQSNDFSVNESILTGESLSVFKERDEDIYKGTVVSSGRAIAIVTATGLKSQLGKIGKSLESIQEEKTPLERQIGSFTQKLVLAGLLVFILVWIINYLDSHDFLDSLLKALTLAMSIIPEEIPVAFTVFMAMGSWRLMKMGIVVKQMKTVETLGSATVICTDKTGTITENRMSLAHLWTLHSNRIVNPDKISLSDDEQFLLATAMWASEPTPFDAMEKALHTAYEENSSVDKRKTYKMVHEYPLSGKPPMMTHVYMDKNGNRIIAAKGAPEAIINVCHLNGEELHLVQSAIKELSNQGYRILAVCDSSYDKEDYPPQQQDLPFNFLGLVAFYDPPKKGINGVIQSFYQAGLDVKIITGDNSETTKSIAQQIQFRDSDKIMTGDELMQLSDHELQQQVKKTTVFSRMFPEAKLRIINALKSNGQIVAMTGDGVNDGPALKAAHIGIAMGKKGTEIAKAAASLILMEDDLAKMVDAVGMGRKIYTNLKKAIQYIISIHIPIILTIFIPLAAGWTYPNIFSPVHVILLELIMGPTCSIIFENEPMEKNTMMKKPRPYSNTFFSLNELSTSILQGIGITMGTLTIYQYAVMQQLDENSTRTLVFIVLISANIFLTLVNRSFYYSILTTLRYPNKLVPLIIFISILITILLIVVPPLRDLFLFQFSNWASVFMSIVIGFVSVIWFEAVKWRIRTNKGDIDSIN